MRPEKYPQFGKMNVGDQLSFYAADIGHLPTFRVVVSGAARRHGIRLMVNNEGHAVTVTRLASDPSQAAAPMASNIASSCYPDNPMLMRDLQKHLLGEAAKFIKERG